MAPNPAPYDAIVTGAGFASLYQLTVQSEPESERMDHAPDDQFRLGVLSSYAGHHCRATIAVHYVHASDSGNVSGMITGTAGEWVAWTGPA